MSRRLSTLKAENRSELLRAILKPKTEVNNCVRELQLALDINREPYDCRQYLILLKFTRIYISERRTKYNAEIRDWKVLIIGNGYTSSPRLTSALPLMSAWRNIVSPLYAATCASVLKCCDQWKGVNGASQRMGKQIESMKHQFC